MKQGMKLITHSKIVKKALEKIQRPTVEIKPIAKENKGMDWKGILITIFRLLPFDIIVKALMVEAKELIEDTTNELDDAAYIVVRTIFEKVGWLEQGDPDLLTTKDTVLGK